MRVWPWSELNRLRRELRATKHSCSAEAKKANRIAAHVKRLDAAITRHKQQERRDQAYIDALESRLKTAEIKAARAEIA